MKNHSFAYKVRELRELIGFTQEQLSEESKLSLRTIQRIESGESIPRGDTLIKLTKTLGVTTEYFLNSNIYEDKGYLMLLNLSSLSFIIHPILGILAPLVMWIVKREKIEKVEETGKRIINFQATWTSTLYLILITSHLIISGFRGNINYIFYIGISNLKTIVFGNMEAPFLLLYLFNIFMILMNFRRSYNGLDTIYKPSIPFL
ncbi:helix-turn-helix domain-containing protein [Saccharicrinis sp. FJH62]|uniref:helix-turn-helix domain-containing protein n=1 Tax=Saccharicrinis sp. FJH62 TaxID=3344657 RepID=UPI0035D4CD95